MILLQEIILRDSVKDLFLIQLNITVHAVTRSFHDHPCIPLGWEP